MVILCRLMPILRPCACTAASLAVAAFAAQWAAAGDFIQPGAYYAPAPQQAWPSATIDAPADAPSSPPGNGAAPPPPAQNAGAPGPTGATPPQGPPSKPEADKDTQKKEEEKKDDENGAKEQNFNLHAQTTAVAQGDPAFAARYSGPNSLNSAGERQETLNADLFVGMRLWHGAELHADALMWEGFGLSQTYGIEDFPNADAYKAGTQIPDFMFAHLFVRQTFGFGGEQEDVPDGQLTLAGKEDVSRLTLTVGRFAATDIFDNNAYAKDAHVQFLNWAGATNITWDYPADEVGFTTGIAAELNQPDWTLRYGVFQMAGQENGFTADDRIFCWPSQGTGGEFWRTWGMALEWEQRYKINDHPGAIRPMVWLDEADMASFTVATALLRANPPDLNVPAGASVTVPAAAFAYRYKYGFGISWDQELTKDVGVFSRIGWNDGQEVAWAYTDVNWSASLGTSIKGEKWHRPDDVFGFMGVLSGASAQQIEFLKAGGTGILNGDGNLTYGTEKVIETYYDFPIGKGCRFAFDYQFVGDPAFNADRGPVNVFAIRLHWEQ